MGFTPRVYKPNRQREKENIIYGVVLDTKRDTKKWIKEIGFKSSKHLTKIEVWQKFGFCPAKTKLSQRNEIIEGTLDPLPFYPKCQIKDLQKIKHELGDWHNF